jgi:hypothetical protein
MLCNPRLRARGGRCMAGSGNSLGLWLCLAEWVLVVQNYGARVSGLGDRAAFRAWCL